MAAVASDAEEHRPTLGRMLLTLDDAELDGWTDLEIFCASCRVTVVHSFKALRRRSRFRRLDEIKPRLVHRHCGKPPEKVALHKVHPVVRGSPESVTEVI